MSAGGSSATCCSRSTTSISCAPVDALRGLEELLSKAPAQLRPIVLARRGGLDRLHGRTTPSTRAEWRASMR
jgi:hypothetical protein